MQRYEPFAQHKLSGLRASLARPLHSLEDLAQLRRALGRGGSGAALARLAAEEPSFAAAFREQIGPALRASALRLLDETPSLALHQAGAASSTAIARAEVPGWLAHLLLGSLAAAPGRHPFLDGSVLLDRTDRASAAKLRCMLACFERISTEPLRGELHIERVVAAPRSAAQWASDTSPLVPLVPDDLGRIESLDLHRQADFANAFLGGGVFSGGAVQEEIRFSVSPELLFGLVLSPRLRDDEVILLRGAERFSTTRGYARSLEFAGALRDPSPRRPDGAADTEVVAMDALHFGKAGAPDQYALPALLREVNKARAAFLRDERNLPVATGNWGCGAFEGDPELKLVLQWIAASAEGRALRYCTFADPRLDGLQRFLARAQTQFETAGELWSWLVEEAESNRAGAFARLNE